jgi:hypothetical protein
MVACEGHSPPFLFCRCNMLVRLLSAVLLLPHLVSPFQTWESRTLLDYVVT